MEDALSRRGAARFPQTLQIFDLFEFQLRCGFGSGLRCNRDRSFLYQMGSKNLYIGQGILTRSSAMRAGVLCRFREHLRGLECARSGQPHPDPHRYRCLLRGCDNYVLFFVIDVMRSSEAFSIESARIAFCRPRANNLAMPAHIPRGRGRRGAEGEDLHPRPSRRRRGRAARRRPLETPPEFLDQRDMYTQAQLDKHCQHYLGQRRYLALRRTWQRVLGGSFGEVYDYFLQRARGAGLPCGPLNVLDPRCTLLLIRWFAARPRLAAWAPICTRHVHGSDHAYTLWHLCTLLPHYHDRLRVQGTLRVYLQALGLPPPGPLVCTIGSAAQLPLARSWIRRVFEHIHDERPSWYQVFRRATRIVVKPIPNFKKAVCLLGRLSQEV